MNYKIVTGNNLTGQIMWKLPPGILISRCPVDNQARSSVGKVLQCVAQIDLLTAVHQEKKLLAVDYTQEQAIEPGAGNAHARLASRNLMGEVPDKLDLVIGQAHRF